MHVSLVRDPVAIRGRDNVLSVGGFFLYRKLIHAEGITSFMTAQLLLSLMCCVRGKFTQVATLDPRRNCTRKKEAWRAEEKVCDKPLIAFEQKRDCTKS